MKLLLKRLAPFALCFILVQWLVRLTLLARAWHDIDAPLVFVPKILLVGAWFDMVVLAFFMLPLGLYWLLLPARFHGRRFDRWASYAGFGIFLFLVGFTGISEHFFWDEFGVRFNFIAVDYLVYTNEVIGNIFESYPVIPIVGAIAAFCAGTTYALRARLRPQPVRVPMRRRAGAFAALLAFAGAMYGATFLRYSDISNNTFTNELSANGIYNLFWAYNHNEIDYKSFYLTHNEDEVDARIRNLLAEEHMQFEDNDLGDITRIVRARNKEQRRNVVMVVMESMSAGYMAHFGSEAGLTPNLDRLADEGLFFTKHYATGTRTVRGLEALTLSIPPTPGQSIVRRPGNENLFSTGFVFKDRGYDTAFIYGGYGYFDNMNYFFAHNGFSIIDRSSIPKDQVQFGNIWGVSDEDLFEEVIKQGDKSYASAKPFFHTVMTTSNHRPYTYPEGRIDIKSGSNRLGGVKYADYAIGKLIEEARTKPWFNNTLFVFVADHTAGASGKVELADDKYHIPLIFYAPGFIKPGRFNEMASQIDVAPMILGQLGISYRSRFYGEDLLHDTDETAHAFISNYQKVAMMKRGQTTILAPKRKLEAIVDDKVVSEKELILQNIDDAVAYYQYASGWRTRSQKIDSRIGAAATHSAAAVPSYVAAAVQPQ